jgi:hypothetical protein
LPTTAEASAAGLGGESLAAEAASDLAGEILEPTGSLVADERPPTGEETALAHAGAPEPDEAGDEAALGEVFTGLPPAVEVPGPVVIEEEGEVRPVELAEVEAQPSAEAQPAEAEAVPESDAQVQPASDDEAAAARAEEPAPAEPRAAAVLTPDESAPAGPAVAVPDTLAALPEMEPEPARVSGNGSAATHGDGSEGATAGPEATRTGEGAVPPEADAASAEPQPTRTGWWSRFVRS